MCLQVFFPVFRIFVFQTDFEFCLPVNTAGVDQITEEGAVLIIDIDIIGIGVFIPGDMKGLRKEPEMMWNYLFFPNTL